MDKSIAGPAKTQRKFFTYLSTFIGLALVSFYFLFTQYAVQGIIVMGQDAIKQGILSIMFYILLAATLLVIIFLLYCGARILEEILVKSAKNIFIQILFYYFLPISLYLYFQKEFNLTVSISVILISVVIRQGMELLFLRIVKKKN